MRRHSRAVFVAPLPSKALKTRRDFLLVSVASTHAPANDATDRPLVVVLLPVRSSVGATDVELSPRTSMALAALRRTYVSSCPACTLPSLEKANFEVELR